MEAWSIGRLAGDEEIDRVLALEAASFPVPWNRDSLVRQLEDPGVTRIYVLRPAAGPLAAYCACWLVADELHINSLAVDAPMRRRGLATALLRHVLADGARAGADRATLEVRRSNAAALRLYERLGFEIEAVRPRYYTQPEEDGLILWRRDLQALAAAPAAP